LASCCRRSDVALTLGDDDWLAISEIGYLCPPNAIVALAQPYQVSGLPLAIYENVTWLTVRARVQSMWRIFLVVTFEPLRGTAAQALS
jgi:hypothetical protein